MTVTKSIKTGADMATIKAALGRLDELAARMEQTWGVDRLPRLVSQELAEAFWRQIRKLNDAVWEGTPADVVTQASRMESAWNALHAAAEACGAPKLDPVVWEVPFRKTGADGLLSHAGVLAVVQTDADTRRVSASVDGRYAMVITLEAVARLVEAFPQLVKVADTFEGAEIIDVRKATRSEVSLDDPLPSNMLEAG